MDLWLVEGHTSGYSVNWKVRQVIHQETTRYQELSIVDTVEFGRALVLDGNVQTTVGDEFFYHEMIAHVPLFTHPEPRRVLVIGGGDGGTVREVVKHTSVAQVDLVEIDERVIVNCRRYLPELSCALDNPRVNVIIADGLEYVQNCPAVYDVVIIDSCDPIGPAAGLFSHGFYAQINNILRDDGLMVAQTQSPLYNRELVKSVSQSLKKLFPIKMVYLTTVPTYMSGFWTFTLASKEYHPLKFRRGALLPFSTRYYTPEIHQAAFVLPKFLQELLMD
ncbi:MAG: polyamine aminopropyltransferase [Firmicutes bacterium]|nr:polyamine aminopropyltransferase [Bacillota bacterium]